MDLPPSTAETMPSSSTTTDQDELSARLARLRTD